MFIRGYDKNHYGDKHSVDNWKRQWRPRNHSAAEWRWREAVKDKPSPCHLRRLL